MGSSQYPRGECRAQGERERRPRPQCSPGSTFPLLPHLPIFSAQRDRDLQRRTDRAHMRIGKIGVIGAGAMGSGIAALAASAGFPVTLLDVPGDADRDATAKAGVQRALKAKPPQFMSADRAALITVGNTADDLASLADCDWIIEAIIEQPGPKRQLFEQLESIVKPSAIV